MIKIIIYYHRKTVLDQILCGEFIIIYSCCIFIYFSYQSNLPKWLNDFRIVENVFVMHVACGWWKSSIPNVIMCFYYIYKFEIIRIFPDKMCMCWLHCTLFVFQSWSFVKVFDGDEYFVSVLLFSDLMFCMPHIYLWNEAFVLSKRFENYHLYFVDI